MFLFRKKKNETDCCSGTGVKSGSCGCGSMPAAEGAREAGCGGEKKARLIVLGACCKKSADTFANVKQAAAELGLADEVVNIGDAAQIAAYGVMQTPALVIGSKVVAYGRLISVEEAKRLIQNASEQ